MKHVRGMTCICNPLVNSYKRLVPGYEAPVNIAWSSMNRSPLIRIPAARGAGTRVEFRSPDGASNPYLVMALCLAAGLDGIKNKLMPPKQVGRNMYMLTDEQLRSMKIGELPRTLEKHAALLRRICSCRAFWDRILQESSWRPKERVE